MASSWLPLRPSAGTGQKCWELTSLTIHQQLSQRSAAKLQQRFQKLTSLRLIDPVCTRYVHPLTKLTMLSIVPSQRQWGSEGFRDGKFHTGLTLLILDLAPLSSLRQLHTLQLQQVQIEQLKAGSTRGLASLTQLQALYLADCSCPDGRTKKYTTSACGPPQDLSALPGLTRLRVLDADWPGYGLARLNGLANLWKVCH